MYPRRMQQQQHAQDQGLGPQASPPSPYAPSSQTSTAATVTPLLSTQHISPQLYMYSQPRPAYNPSASTATQQPRRALGQQQQCQFTHTLVAPLPSQTSASSSGFAMDSQQQQLLYQQNYLQQLQQFRQMREQQMQIRPGTSGGIGSDPCRSMQGVIDVERHGQQYKQHLLQAQQTQKQKQKQLDAPRQPRIQPCHRGASPQGFTPMTHAIASGSGSTTEGTCALPRLSPRTLPLSRASPNLGPGRCNPYPIRTRGQRDPGDAAISRTASATPELSPARQSRGEPSSTRLTDLLRDQPLPPHRSDGDPSSEPQQQPPEAPRPSPSPRPSETPPTSQPLIQVNASDQSESSLPPHAPISMYCPPRPDPASEPDIDMSTAGEEDPIEVTLNIDIPKTSAAAAAGVPHITVLSVNPSWHCVFVETVQQLQTQQQVHSQQQQRIRTSIRIQFCPSPVSHRVRRTGPANMNTGTTPATTSSRTYGGHREMIQRLRTVQVISYASRQVELTRRICGQNLLKKGGIVIHLDPLSITFNEASYGFTLSLSSFVAESLSRIHSTLHSKPDEPLPLTRQQNSAYCRRNLKELYYDTISKDVVITVQPSGEVFYAHSVVLENYGYFRALLEKAAQESGSTTVLVGSNVAAGGEMHEETNVAGTRNNNDNGGNNAASQAAVDEEGYAQPLHQAQPPAAPQQQTRPQVRQRQHLVPLQGQQNNDETNTRQNRVKIKIEFQDTHPNAFRAVLHYMYMGHVPTVVAPLVLGIRQQQHQHHMPATVTTGLSSSQGVDTDTTSASTSSSARSLPLSSSLSPPAPEEFSWRELYEVATQFQLTGLMHLSKLVLIARLDGGLAVRELFEWAYRHWSLVPSYVSFLIENMEPDLLLWEQKHGRGSGVAGRRGTAVSSTTSMAKSVLWPYHDRCPRFEDIMAMFLQMLNDRKEARTLV